MQQFNLLQIKLNDKNNEISDLTTQLKQSKHLFDNFRYLASLNLEYFSLDIGDGKKKYSEKDKIDLEKAYIIISRQFH